MYKYAYIDFEYNSSAEKKLNLVCCSLTINNITKSIWLYNDIKAQQFLRSLLLKYIDYTFVSYSVEAEARSFIALNLNPLKFKWFDLYLEYRQILNHSGMSYGKHLDNKGKIQTIGNPIAAMNFNNISYYDAIDVLKNEELTGKLTYGLASACYKLLDVMIDTKEKTDVRNIIIEDICEMININRERIIQYCESDVKYLPQLLFTMKEQVIPKYYTDDEYTSITLNRAEYAVRTAIMVTHGYPINVEALKLLTSNIPKVLEECRRDINRILNSQGIIEPFYQDKRGEWHFNKKKIQDYITANLDTSNWERTDKGQISLSDKALKKQGASRHEYRDNLIDQLARWAAIEATFRGFKDPVKSNGKRLTDYLGTDGRIRPYFSIYGAQSSRSQPSATSFVFLKSAWIRVLVQPSPGSCIIASDYSSQEFLLSAVISGDNAMEEAYNSGDVYLAFAVQSGMIKEPLPKFGELEFVDFKKKYDTIRNTCKSLVLGLSYMMGAANLAKRLTAESKSGEIFYKEDAQKLSDLFHQSYPVFTEWQENMIAKYQTFRDPITLPCGWKMFGQNPNPRSVGNMPIQGTGASIMRKAVELCQNNGLRVIMTLHDCLYIESPVHLENEHTTLLQKYMQEAFNYYFPNSTIRCDAKSWGIGTKNPYHIDPRGYAEWLQYYKYVMPDWKPVDKAITN